MTCQNGKNGECETIGKKDRKRIYGSVYQRMQIDGVWKSEMLIKRILVY